MKLLPLFFVTFYCTIINAQINNAKVFEQIGKNPKEINSRVDDFHTDKTSVSLITIEGDIEIVYTYNKESKICFEVYVIIYNENEAKNYIKQINSLDKIVKMNENLFFYKKEKISIEKNEYHTAVMITKI